MRNEFITRYVSVWNNPSQAEIRQLWAPDAIHAIETGQWQGHEEIEVRVTGAYKEFVQQGEYLFKPAGDAETHNNATKFTATMVRTTTGEIEWTGTVFVLFDADGQIKYDYQFTNQDAATRVVVNEFLRRTEKGDSVTDLFAPGVDHPADMLGDVQTVLFDRTDAVILGEKSALSLTVEDTLITGRRFFRG
jgi:uncharacterized protein